MQTSQTNFIQRINELEHLILKILNISTKELAIIKCCDENIDKDVLNFLKSYFSFTDVDVLSCKTSIKNNRLPSCINVGSLNKITLSYLQELGLKQIKCTEEEYNSFSPQTLTLIKSCIVIDLINSNPNKQKQVDEAAYVPPALRKQQGDNSIPSQYTIPPKIKNIPQPVPVVNYNSETETILKITQAKSANVIYRIDTTSGSFTGLLNVFGSCKKGLLLFKLTINNKVTSFATCHSIFPTQMGTAISDGSEYVFSIVNDPFIPHPYYVKPFNKTMMIKEDRIAIFSIGTFIKKNHSIRYNGKISDLFDVPKTISPNAIIPYNHETTTPIQNGWSSISVIELK
ncbi:hypothetical protein EDI_343140 [Entamoeba dispar SAW760]|uniref:Uncharacterized protein n=1 Tax=Entamoeba dispar (strain ATCC PRA-260 / SAW760) TaxID=370354 RepID=B0ESV5_ENTDS|nr:uncharacterized protein EDI_343140 [Entamoeba dispar SAW760]EDR22382.1 hypothetical protein EDI_343140 [Entamoeba dispar SAW760]|eukprot:EDR22382.1 hypothetical protein EDI_343140 [Entamoeba dispar SAW760]